MNKFSTTSGLSLPSHPERILTQIRCPKCGKWAIVDTSMVLTSYPPQYGCHCHDCGNVFYIFCSELGRRTDVRTYDEDGTIRENLKVGPNDTVIGPVQISDGGTGTVDGGIKGYEAISDGVYKPIYNDLNLKTISIPLNLTVNCSQINLKDNNLSLEIIDADKFFTQFDSMCINGVEFERKK